MARTLQEGIYYQEGVRPGLFFAIVFLRTTETATAAAVHADLVRLWELYQNLKRGVVPDHPDRPVPGGNLTVLLAYGPNFFKMEGTATSPVELAPRHRFLSPEAMGGGRLLSASGLRYGADIVWNIATEALAVQFVADTQLAVYRAVLETAMLLSSRSNQAMDHGLAFGGFFDGFSREDGRSWIGFHDGVSNMKSGLPRENAIRIKTGPNTNGSTLCYLRLQVDISAWRQLSRAQQELIVGRDKLSGCPFSHVNAAGTPVVAAGCPLPGTSEVTESANVDFRLPTSVAPEVRQLRQSHVQRANLQHRSDTDVAQSLRIFRQGYEFLETLGTSPGFRAGLNFVSFQDSPSRVISILTRTDWLGQTNFGGDSANPLPGMANLLIVRAGAIFLVPPQDDTLPFPGADFFSL